MRDLDELLPDVLAQAPNCPEPTALRALRDAAREFCTATRIWREWDSFKLSSPECEGLSTIQDAQVVEIQRADLNDVMLIPVTVGWLDEHVPDWASYVEDAGSARYVTQLVPNTITVVPKVAGTLKVRLVLTPSRQAMTLPDFLVDQYGTQLGRAASGNVLVIQGQEWTNPQLGSALLSEFKDFLATTKVTVAKGQQRAPLRTRPSWF